MDPGQGGGPADNAANVRPIDAMAASWGQLGFYDQNYVVALLMRDRDHGIHGANYRASERREALTAAIAILETHPGRKRAP